VKNCLLQINESPTIRALSLAQTQVLALAVKTPSRKRTSMNG